MRKKSGVINNLIVVSDLHIGSSLALCPREGFSLDDGGRYQPSKLQRKIWNYWEQFWGEWVPKATHGEPYAVVLNGDAIDGSHHGSTEQISQNIDDQRRWCMEIMKPVIQKCEGRFYFIRGTEVHIGKSGCDEEAIARELGSIPNADGRCSRWELWKNCGKGLVHFAHHVGTTGSNHFESTAVHKELIEAYTEAGRWGNRPPDIIVRSHRHRCIQTTVPTMRDGETSMAIAITTPAWQAKTPFCYRVAGARQSLPQFGGILIRQGDEELHTRMYCKSPERDQPE